MFAAGGILPLSVLGKVGGKKSEKLKKKELIPGNCLSFLI